MTVTSETGALPAVTETTGGTTETSASAEADGSDVDRTRSWRARAQAVPGAQPAWRAARLGARALRAQSLTGPGGVLLGLGVLGPGVVVDLVTDATVGWPTFAAFLAASATVPLVVRTRALASAVVLPPLLFAGAVLTLAQLGGQNSNRHQVVLDTGLTLALNAPVLFAGTAGALLLVLGRLIWGWIRR